MSLTHTQKQKIRILCVDDFPTMRRLIKSMLSKMGYLNVDTANDGAMALEMLRQNPYDLLVSDWNMPNVSGLELLLKVRNDPNLKHIPVLMVTAEVEKENIVGAVKAGVNGYIVKPFTQQSLQERVDKILEKLVAAQEASAASTSKKAG